MSSPIQISTGQAQVSAKNIAGELMSLSPSSLITLFEIDVSALGFDIGIISQTEVSLQINTLFRFHNNINLTSNSLYWQGNEYIAAPIIAENFETNLKGSPAIPTLSISVSEAGIPQLSILKQRLRAMGDLVGAKVTRIRTFGRFIDATNFYGQNIPQNFYPDPTQELPRDIFYIDRLSNENKNFMQYELSPLFIVEGITLPGRIISEYSCPWQYRAEGCLYEYSGRETYIHNGGTLPAYAPPVANSLDQLFSTLVTGVPYVDRGAYNINQSYNMGEFCYIENRGIKYYFISQVNNNNSQPPNSSGWIADECAKRVLSCKYRWQNIGSGILPYGGFPSVSRFQ
jgi:lambda family phage minor tail protein L